MFENPYVFVVCFVFEKSPVLVFYIAFKNPSVLVFYIAFKNPSVLVFYIAFEDPSVLVFYINPFPRPAHLYIQVTFSLVVGFIEGLHCMVISYKVLFLLITAAYICRK